jgi:hypothetical protein
VGEEGEVVENVKGPLHQNKRSGEIAMNPNRTNEVTTQFIRQCEPNLRIFLSHSGKDETEVRRVAEILGLMETSPLKGVQPSRLREIERILNSHDGSKNVILNYDTLVKWGILTTHQDADHTLPQTNNLQFDHLRITPPFNPARIISLLLSPEISACVLGDLQERHALILKTHGVHAATRWFYREVLHSFFSLAFDKLKSVSGIEKLFRRIG